MKKKSLILFVCLFFFNFINVEAATVVRETGSASYCSFEGHRTIFKKLKIGDTTKNAYCAEHDDLTPKAGNNYKKVSKFSKDDTCSFKVSNSTVTGLDCSKMVGHVLGEAYNWMREKKGWTGSNYKKKRYYYAQIAMQSYLKQYSTNWQSSNDVYSGKYKKMVKNILKQAYNSYKASENSLQEDKTTLDVALTANKNDIGMYYNNGYYYSYEIVAKIDRNSAGDSTGGTVARLDLTIPDSNTSQICIRNMDGSENCQDEFVEGNGIRLNNVDSQQVSFWVRTTGKSSVKVVAEAYYQSSAKSATSVSYDSVMYKKSNGYANDSAYQNLIVYYKYENDAKIESETDSFEGSITLTPNIINQLTCANNFTGYSTATSSTINNKFCRSDEHSNVADYTAEFNNCRNISVSVPFWTLNGEEKRATATVSIAANGYFRFGSVVGDTVPIKRGQGFYLQQLGTVQNGVSSDSFYKVSLSWKHNYYYNSGSNLYFVLDYKGNIHHNDTVCYSKDCKSKANVDAVVASNLQKVIYDSFGINGDTGLATTLSTSTFKTYKNDNDDTLQFVPAIVSVNGTFDKGVAWKPGESRTLIYNFSTPYAYFDRDHKVYYSTDKVNGKVGSENLKGNSNYIPAGNRYYTDLKFVGPKGDIDKFYFNVSTSSLSPISGLNWNLDAKCEIELQERVPSDGDTPPLYTCDDDKNCVYNYSYRTISVSNPFPRYTPVNWESWYENSTNRLRLANTFKNSTVYSGAFLKENLSLISGYSNVPYSSWSSIDLSNGKSKFVSDVYKYNSSGLNSYCPIGFFYDNCDR